jgi:nitrogen fixation/metabolism regulation signal transduction histidine kinase
MAHEIKNPLTPIQLSAERIAQSFRRMGANGDHNGSSGRSGQPVDEASISAVIDECTETITREVSGLKAMVDEFSRFARLPLARLEPADLNEVVRHSVALYEDRLNGVQMETKLDPTVPSAMLDAEQLRRVFVNLIDNALGALSDMEGERTITIATTNDSTRSLLIAEISDTGHGIRSGGELSTRVTVCHRIAGGGGVSRKQEAGGSIFHLSFLIISHLSFGHLARG